MKKPGIVIVFVVFVALSCSKDLSSSFVPYANLNINDTSWAGGGTNTGILDSIAGVIDTLSFVVDSFDCSTGKSIACSNNDNLQVNFPPMCNGSGGSSMVKAAILILKKRGDFIRVLAHTKNIEKPLEASYCFYIQLTNKAGQEIAMPPGISYTISWKDANANSKMAFFEGYASRNVDTLMNWMPSTGGNIHPSFQPGSTNVKGYELITNTTHWIGGLKYIDTSAGTTAANIGFNSLNFTNKNTISYVVLRDTKTVIRMASDNSNKTFYCTKIPIGARVTFVTISPPHPHPHLGTRDETIAAGTNIFKIMPDKKTVNDIHNFLESL